jgi:steroid delta-isomerase-like uncharacterized protein
MVTSTISKLSQDYLAAFNSHNMERFISFYANDCVVEDIGLAQTYHGVREVRKTYENLYKAFPDIKMEFKNDFRSGDWSATEWVMTGTNTGELSGLGNMPAVPATNKKMSHKGATIVQWRGDKIIRETDYYNVITMMQQLGLMPSMPGK